MREMKLQAEGIVCSGCAEDMERLLGEEDGIVDAVVDYSKGTVHVKYDESLIDGKKVFERVRRLGFPVKIVSHV
jgi:copper chaperone CopZ